MTSLLTLPLEIRSNIYGVLLSATRIWVKTHLPAEPIRREELSNDPWNRLAYGWKAWEKLSAKQREERSVKNILPILFVCRQVTSEIQAKPSHLSGVVISIAHLGMGPWRRLPVEDPLTLSTIYDTRFKLIKPRKVIVECDVADDLFDAIHRGGYSELEEIIAWSWTFPYYATDDNPSPAMILLNIDHTFSSFMPMAFSLPKWRFRLSLQSGLKNDEVRMPSST